MEDKQKKYLDKVVEFLIRDTTIDFNSRKISYPFVLFFPLPHISPARSLALLSSSFFPVSPPNSFSTYVRDMYGLTENEKEYVWNEYKKNIKDKIENGR